MNMNNLMSCTGFTLNWCDKYNPDKFDMFVIFNEAWGIPEQSVIDRVTEIVEEYLSETDITDMDNVKIAIDIMDRIDRTYISGWGVQVYIRARR